MIPLSILDLAPAHRPDELQLIANVFDHAARVRSFALASEAFAS